MKPVLPVIYLAIAANAQPVARPVKPVPPQGIELPAQDRPDLESGLQHLKASVDKIKDKPLLADVLIYHEAVRYALQYQEFFKADEIAKAQALLQHSEERARQLSEGASPWTTSAFATVPQFAELATATMAYSFKSKR